MASRPIKPMSLPMHLGFAPQARGFTPLWSFAQGGLAEAWTGGVYPFTDAELQDFPFDYEDIAPFYNEAARRIGVSGINDDLGKFFPLQESLLEPLELDEHSALLLAEYHKQRDFLNRQLACYFGRARIATLSQRQHDREPCCILGDASGVVPHRRSIPPRLRCVNVSASRTSTTCPGSTSVTLRLMRSGVLPRW